MFDKNLFLKGLDRAMDDIADEIFSKSQQNIIDNGTSDTGFLLRSGNVERSYLLKSIVYSAPYAEEVEYGSKPHWVSAKKLFNWCRLKLRLNEKKAWRAAYAISNKISKQGTPAQPFLVPALNSVIYGREVF